MKCLLFVGLVSMAISGAAQAQETWSTTAVSSAFSNGSNWSNGAPVAATATSYTFSGSSTFQTVNIDAASSYLFTTLTFSSGASSYAIQSEGGTNPTTSYRFLTQSVGSVVNDLASTTETVNATIASTGGALAIEGSGSGQLTLASLRASNPFTTRAERNVTIGDINGTAGDLTLNIDAGATSGTSNIVEISDNSGSNIGALEFGASTATNLGFAGLKTDVATTTTASITQTTDASFTGAGAFKDTGLYTVMGSADKNIYLNNSGGVTLAGSSMQIGAANGTSRRNVILQAGNGSVNTISSVITSSASTGGGSLVVEGSGTGAAGTVNLTGANTYVGTTTVNSGTLLVNNTSGSATGTGAVGVGSTATIGGGNGASNSGTLQGEGTGAFTSTLKVYQPSAVGTISGALTINSGGILAPGNAGNAGTLTTAALTLNSGSILNYYFSGTANSLTFVTGSGGLTLNGGGFNLYQQGTTTAFDTTGTYSLFGYTGTISGSIADLSILNEASGYTYSFVNDTTDGLVQLDIAAAVAPEPGTWAMFLGGLAVLVCWQRRSRFSK